MAVTKTSRNFLISSGGLPSENPSALPPDERTAPESMPAKRTKSKSTVDPMEAHRKNWKDSILRDGAKAVYKAAALLDVTPAWKEKLDLAHLAIELAKLHGGNNPADFMREAGELILEAGECRDWLAKGRNEEAERAGEQEFRDTLAEELKPDEWDELGRVNVNLANRRNSC